MSNVDLNWVFFSVGFPDIPEPVLDIWQVLTGFLERERSLPKMFELSPLARHGEDILGEERLRLTPDAISSFLASKKLVGFSVNAGRHPKMIWFSLLNAKGLGRQSELRCQIDKDVKAPNDWSQLVQAIAVLTPIIGAWQWQMPYQSWQWNFRVDLGYERSFGEIPPGFRRWHEPSIDGIGNGRILVDTSLNPGRPKELIPTINFYPTAEMWLGPHFWQYAKCTKEEALAADFFIEKRDTPHYLYLKCWPEPFTRPDGEQGRMQQRLWKLFFHEDCEWPPGSGTICDEPMYGPP
ncbi:hypothetical protein HNR46_004259, partial [Haloferula luteola]